MLITSHSKRREEVDQHRDATMTSLAQIVAPIEAQIVGQWLPESTNCEPRFVEECLGKGPAYQWGVCFSSGSDCLPTQGMRHRWLMVASEMDWQGGRLPKAQVSQQQGWEKWEGGRRVRKCLDGGRARRRQNRGGNVSQQHLCAPVSRVPASSHPSLVVHQQNSLPRSEETLHCLPPGCSLCCTGAAALGEDFS